jgi:hypothetical protein
LGERKKEKKEVARGRRNVGGGWWKAMRILFSN